MATLLNILQIGNYDYAVPQSTVPTWISYFPLIAIISFAIGCYVSYLIIVKAVTKAMSETVQQQIGMIEHRLIVISKLLDDLAKKDISKGTNNSFNEIYKKIHESAETK